MSRAREEAEEYVTEAAPRLLNLARALTRDRDEAEDLLQDTLTKVFTSWSKVRRAEQIDAYVRRIMVNTLISERSRRRYAAEVSRGDLEIISDLRAPVPAATEGVEGSSYVLRVLGTLSPMPRVVLTLRFLEDLKDEEIAEELGVSRAAVATAASRGLAALREHVTRADAAEGRVVRPLRAVSA